MRRLNLGSTLQHILTASIAATAVGCGGIDTDEFEPVKCADGRVDVLSDLRLAEKADYLELREIDPYGGATMTVRQSFGKRCGGAEDKAACEAAIDAVSVTTGFRLGQCVQICPDYVLVVNRGQDVSVIDTSDGVRGQLGAIDSPADAILAASLEGYTIGCGEKAGFLAVGSDYELLATRITSDCDPVESTLYRLRVTADGTVSELESEIIESEDGICIGRRPVGLRARRARGTTAAGAYWGSVAHLEAASVHAFAALKNELTHHRAPARLIRGVERSMRDEVRHAALTRKLAARYGGCAPRPRVVREPRRTLEELALENAAEGCVRETFGALVGKWQARFAGDPEVRRVMRQIESDETRHASLAWSIDRWLQKSLSPSARKRVVDARHDALARLRAEVTVEPAPELVAVAGVPNAKAASELLRTFSKELALG